MNNREKVGTVFSSDKRDRKGKSGVKNSLEAEVRVRWKAAPHEHGMVVKYS